MTKFENPTNSSECQPNEADVAPPHHEVADRSEQVVAPDGVAAQLGATACQEAFCQMCAHYREAESNDMDPATGQGPDDVDERIEMSSAAVSVPVNPKKVAEGIKGILVSLRSTWNFSKKDSRRQNIQTEIPAFRGHSSKSPDIVESTEQVVLTNSTSYYDGERIKIAIPEYFYEGLEGISNESRKPATILRSRIWYHEELLRYLIAHENELTKKGDEMKSAMAALQFEVIDVTKKLKKELGEIERDYIPRFVVVSSVAG